MTHTNIVIKKEGAKIVHSGCGGFLNPPTHPEHNKSVESTRRDQFIICLTTASTCDWIKDNVRIAAKELLDSWIAPDIDSEEIQDWIHQVLGYFRNCYSPDGVDRNVSNCKITNGNPFEIGIMRHLGVLHILKYYPEYEPKGTDFLMSYWGSKEKKESYKSDPVKDDYIAGTKYKFDGKTYVITKMTNLMIMFYDEEDQRINPKILKETKLVFGTKYKPVKK